MQWPVLEPRVTQAYGCHNCAASGFHSGLDITDATVANGCPGDPPVLASAAGSIYRTVRGCVEEDGCVGVNCCGRGFGNHVVIDHQNGLYSVYAHMESLDPGVWTGQSVSSGQELGVMGATGAVSGCHVHFGILDFPPGSNADYEYPGNPLGSAGFSAYTTTDYPSDNCAAPGLGCPDPTGYLHDECVDLFGPGTLSDRPEDPPSCPLNASVADAVQRYVSLGSYVDQSGVWNFIMLPHDDGPTGDSQFEGCDPDATHGWALASGQTPAECTDVEVDGETVGSAGAPVFSSSDGAVEITRVWGGHRFGALSTAAPNGQCSANWYEISIPSERGNGVLDSGWVCGESLNVGGGSCNPLIEGACGGVPVVTTTAASGITQTSAALNMTVNPNGASTTAWFVWERDDPTPDFNESPLPHAGVGAGSTSIPFSWTIANLECGSTYYFEAHAENNIGAVTGAILSFVTDDCGGGGGTQTQELITNGDFESGPTGWVRTGDFHIDDQPCPYSGSDYAFLAEADGTWGNSLYGTLSQVISIPSDATTVELSYRYSIDTTESGATPLDFMNVWLYDETGSTVLDLFEIYSNVDAQGGCGSGFYDQDTFDISEYAGEDVQLRFEARTDGSLPTVFRVDAVSVEATIPSGQPPSVTTELEDQVTQSTARLNMTVDPNGLPTDVWFDFEAGDSTPNDDTEHIGVGSGTEPQLVSISVTNLDCDTQYYFEANASNSAGADDGSTLWFFTDPCSGEPPTADTDPAEAITTNSARVTADILPNGLPTNAWFEWGETTALGNSTPQQGVGSGSSWVDVEHTITDLTCGTLYYFEAHAVNAEGEDDGATHSFTTLDCGTPVPDEELLLFTTRQSCDGPEPAVLLRWTMPADADPVVTVRRIDGQYTAVVDTAIDGPIHVVNSGLSPGANYGFVVEASVQGAPVVSNTAAARIFSAQCAFPVGPGEAPHWPLLWAEPPFCEGGVPKVKLRWTEVGGASRYDLQRLSPFDPTANFVDLTGGEFVDSTVSAGLASDYLLTAVNDAGTAQSWQIGVLVPGTICGDPGDPGPFTAAVTEPVCVGTRGEVTVTWTESAGAVPDYRRYELYNHLLQSAADDDEDFQDDAGGVLEPGYVVRVVVQAESESAPGQYREAREVARLIPTDVCGGGTQPPLAQTQGPPNIWVEETAALVRASIKAQGSPTIAYIEWGPDASYGALTPPRDVGSGFEFVTLGEELTNLECNATYHFRAVATNALGTTFGVDRTLTAEACSNQPPAAADDTYSTSEDSELGVGAPGVLTNDTDPDDDPLTAILVDDVLNGILSLSGDGSFTYVPDPDFSGADSFTYKVSDGMSESNVATVTISVTEVNDAPVAGDDAYSTVEDMPINIVAPGVLENDTDADGDVLSAVLVSNPTSGVLTLNADGSFGYTPNAEFGGSDSFVYTASDGTASSPEATATINVTPVNDPPMIVIVEPDGVGDTADLAFTIEWVDGDVDSDASIALGRSSSDTCGDETTIVNGLSENDPLNQYVWDTTLMPNGSYWVQGVIDDGTSGPVGACSAGPLTVVHTCPAGGNTYSAELQASASQAFMIGDEAQHGLDEALTGLTLEAWVKLSSVPPAGQAYVLASKYISIADGSYELAYENTGGGKQIRLTLSDGSESAEYLLGWVIPPGEWHHVAATWNAVGPEVNFVIDDFEFGASPTNHDTVANSSVPFVVGAAADLGGGFLDGLVDEARVWNIARTGTEIIENMSRQVPCSEPGLVGYWRFNDDGGEDYSGHLNHLTPQNGPEYSTDRPFPILEIFSDDFESGNTSAWSVTVP